MVMARLKEEAPAMRGLKVNHPCSFASRLYPLIQQGAKRYKPEQKVFDMECWRTPVHGGGLLCN